MAQANLGGLAGVAFGGLASYGVYTALGKGGQSGADAVAWSGVAGCVAASLFGLMYDRSVVPEFRRSYKVLTRHFVRGERGGPDYDPRERVAMFGIPVAFATFLIPMIAGLLWFVAWYSERQGAGRFASTLWFATYFIAGLAGVALTMIVGNATADHRLLQREIAFNMTPVPQYAQQSAVATATDAPPTEAELAQLRTRGRRDAVIAIIGGALLLGLNHYLALHEGKFYPKLVFGGPMIIMCGLFGLFEPRVMTRHLPVGKHYPKTILLLVLVALVIGAAIGWPIYTWYHGGA